MAEPATRPSSSHARAVAQESRHCGVHPLPERAAARNGPDRPGAWNHLQSTCPTNTCFSGGFRATLVSLSGWIHPAFVRSPPRDCQCLGGTCEHLPRTREFEPSVRLLPRPDPRLDVRVLDEREAADVRDLPRMRSAGHPHDSDLAPLAEEVSRVSSFRHSTHASPHGPVSPPAMSSNGSSATSSPVRSHQSAKRATRLGSLHVGLVVAAVALVLLVIFLAQNAHTVDVSFLGGHLRVSLAVAMLTASVAGALIVGAAGAARIGQLRRSVRRDSRTRVIH
jgi:putative membrane protein